MLVKQEPSVQSADRIKAVPVWSRGNMYLTKPGKGLSPESISKNKYWIPWLKESQTTISESSHIQWCFIQQKAHLCFRPYNLDNIPLNRPSIAWESLNITQKLGLFLLGATHILNLPKVCIKLMQVVEWV